MEEEPYHRAAAVYAPFVPKELHTLLPGWSDWELMLAIALPLYAVTELVKQLRWRRVSGAV